MKQEIRVGQIWADNDSRMKGRQGTVVEVNESTEKALINWGRKTWVSFERLRKISQYRLIHDPEHSKSLRPFKIDVDLDEMVGSQRSYCGCATLLVWAESVEDASKLMLEFLKERGKMLQGPEDEDCSYQIHDIQKKRGVEVMSGIV